MDRVFVTISFSSIKISATPDETKQEQFTEQTNKHKQVQNT